MHIVCEVGAAITVSQLSTAVCTPHLLRKHEHVPLLQVVVVQQVGGALQQVHAALVVLPVAAGGGGRGMGGVGFDEVPTCLAPGVALAGITQNLQPQHAQQRRYRKCA